MRVTVTLSTADAARLRELGGGNASAGVRWLLTGGYPSEPAHTTIHTHTHLHRRFVHPEDDNPGGPHTLEPHERL